MRPFAWLAVLALAVLWLALPASDSAEVAVQRIGVLLRSPIEGEKRSLADELLEPKTAEGALPSDRRLEQLALGGVRFAVPGVGIEDLTIHGRARRAVIAALRQAALEGGNALEIQGELSPVVGGTNILLSLRDGQLYARVHRPPGAEIAASIPAPPSDRRALLPALAAIALMLVWRRPLLALFVGLSLGTFLLFAADPATAPQAWDGFPRRLAQILSDELSATADWKPMATMLALLATWAITARNGGLGGWSAWLSQRATDARRAQFVTWICAVSACFEAPGKNVALGWMLRTTAVRARVSAEKFAWLLDATGSAILGLCVVSPWSGYAFDLAATQSGFSQDPGQLWLETLPWRSFCWLTLAFGPLVLWSGRDFGSMLAAERRAREGLGASARGARMVFKAPEPDPRSALQAWRVLAPFAVFSLALAAQGLRDSGALSGEFKFASRASWLSLAQAAARPDASMIAALAALLVALVLSSVAGAERGVPAALLRGLRAALRPCLLIFGAWALGFISSRLGAGEVLAAALGERVAPQTLPALLFALSAAISFCFGSAWVALALIVPLAGGLAAASGSVFAAGPAALAAMSLAAVLEGSLAGALLSPLSTSSLSASIGAGADHADHLRTQSPYALLTLVSVLLFGFLGAGLYGLGPWAALALVALAHAAVFTWLSRRSERRPA